jgi:hypothetical protein
MVHHSSSLGPLKPAAMAPRWLCSARPSRGRRNVPSRRILDGRSRLEKNNPSFYLNPSRRSPDGRFVFNEVPWTCGPRRRGPGLQTIDLFHRFFNRKIIHEFWKVAGPSNFAKTPLIFFSKLCFSPWKFTYRSLYNFLYLQLGPFLN